MYAAARKAIPSGVNSPVRYYAPHPFFASRARGGALWDEDGRKYVDFCNGYGAVMLGHAHPAVSAAVSAQLRRGELYGAPTGAETELASLIGRAFPSMKKTRLVSTGGEATMAAVRLARAHTGRDKIVKFEGCYHGAHDAMLVRAGSASAGAAVSAGVPGAVARQTLVAKYNDLEGAERLIERDDVGGVIVEPILANMGLVPPARGFLRGLRSAARRAGVPLIFDEIVTGFRAAPGGAQELYGVRPDITTLGKALGNGFAIAAVGGGSRVMDQLAPEGGVFQAGTFSGNPVSVAAAAAALKEMRRSRGMHARLARACASLAAEVSDHASSLGIEHSVNSAASMFQIFFAPGPVTDYASAAASDRAAFGRLFRGLLRGGVFAPPSQFETAFLSDAHTEADLARAARAYRAALRAVRA